MVPYPDTTYAAPTTGDKNGAPPPGRERYFQCEKPYAGNAIGGLNFAKLAFRNNGSKKVEKVCETRYISFFLMEWLYITHGSPISAFLWRSPKREG